MANAYPRALALLLLLALAAVALLNRPPATGAQSAPAVPLQQRIDAAADGDTIIVDGGEYHEHIVIDKPLLLIGRNRPVIDGGGDGTVVTITADDAVFSGFEVRGSGRAISQESSAIRVDGADRVTIRANHVRDSHYGLYLLDTDGSTIADNDVRLRAEDEIGRRGYGVYFWEVSNTVLHGNVVRDASDGIHLEFSDENGIGENQVTRSRYGLHFMYSDGNTVLSNTFRDNLAGAVLMFSHDMLLKDNEFSSNRRGATGAGILFKDSDDIYAEGNRLLRNKYGMTVEGTPQSIGSTAVFRENLFALNDTGIGLMSNAPITFVENAMIDNTVQVEALSRANARGALSSHGGAVGDAQPAPGADDRASELPSGAVWALNGRGNYWSDYKGFDADGDGVGDSPYRPEPPFAGRLDDNETLRFFQFTLAQQAVDMSAELFPVYRYDAVIEDSGPLMEPPAATSLADGQSFNEELLAVSVGLVLFAGWIALSLLEIRPAHLLRNALGLRPPGRLGGQTPT